MRVYAILWAMLIALTAFGCGDSETKPDNKGGSGGSAGEGGEGGGGEGGEGGDGKNPIVRRKEICQDYCAPLAACEFIEDEDDCVDECRWSLMTDEYVETCGSCLNAAECEELEEGSACVEECRTSTFDLEIKSVGFQQLAGKKFHIFVSRINDNAILSQMHYVLDGSDVSRTYKNILIENVTYRVEYWVDSEEDGRCNASDLAGMVTWEDVRGPQTFVMDADAKTNTAACTRFSTVNSDLTVKGTNVSAWAGKTLWFDATHPVGEEEEPMVPFVGSVKISGNSFEKHFVGALQQRQGYTLNYMVDMDDDGACGAADHVGTIGFTSSGHQVIELSPADPQPAGGRTALNWVQGDITFHGVDLAEHNGKMVRVLLTFLRGGDEFVAGRDKGTIVDGEVRITLKNQSQANGKVYWFVDVDGNGACSQGDLGGVYTAQPRAGHHTTSLPTPQLASCRDIPFPGHDVVFAGSGFPAVTEGQRGFLILDRPGQDPVLAQGLMQGGAFEARFLGAAAAGSAYEAFGFVDLDGDRRCTPGLDPSWLISVASSSSDRLLEVTPATTDGNVCHQVNSYYGE